ncbi:arylsulfatase [Joostella atrarenae]|uniref:Arylsulfatase n=1 Tax=Joostella atrarenae TaxID=679257 RepID=A0ABS9J2Z2_9FLAO|nr:arylsulfatase [Joostella atrarenae]MCF8714718.1 arylsulfatase [Joostella atrarenae]
MPNILLIVTDDQGYGDMSCHGNPWLKTPNIDKLYQESTRLTDFHVSPTCSPTRAALLTGHYANRTGVWHTVGGRSLLRENEITIAEVLRKEGYKTGIFGKWHLGDNIPFRPQDRGFDEVLVHGGGGVGQQPDFWNNNYYNDTYFHNGKPEKYNGYCTDVWFESATKFIKEKSDTKEPFFCYVSTNAPHSPHYVENKYSDKYQDNDSIVDPFYYGMIDNLDYNIGNMMRSLDSLGIEDNTIVIFMSDNGTTNHAGLVLDEWDGYVVKGYNAGMRGSKVSMYEGGHRVPFFIRWPNGGVKPGRDIDALTAHVDVFPTLLEMLSIKNEKHIKFDGESLWDLIGGRTDTMRKRTLITDSQRLEYPEKWRRSATMQNKWRLINGKELYDLNTDPEQRIDIANKYPEKVKELRDEYEKWWLDIKPDLSGYPAIYLGTKEEPETIINTMDLHPDENFPEVPWHQRHIRIPVKITGWYATKFMETGRYRFKLYRWPPEEQKALFSKMPAYPGVLNTNIPELVKGESIDIKKAQVSVDGKEVTVDINKDKSYVAIELSVNKGFHKLRTDFIDDKEKLFSAYYVGIEKIN